MKHHMFRSQTVSQGFRRRNVVRTDHTQLVGQLERHRVKLSLAGVQAVDRLARFDQLFGQNLCRLHVALLG